MGKSIVQYASFFWKKIQRKQTYAMHPVPLQPLSIHNVFTDALDDWPDYFAITPNDIIFLILNELNPTALIAMSKISKRLKQLAEDDRLWKKFLLPNIDIPEKMTSKQVFETNYFAISREYRRFAPVTSKLSCMIKRHYKYFGYTNEHYLQLLWSEDNKFKPAIANIFPALVKILDILDARVKEMNNAMSRKDSGAQLLSMALYRVLEKNKETASLVREPKALKIILKFLANKPAPFDWQLIFLAEIIMHQKVVKHSHLRKFLIEVTNYLRDSSNHHKVTQWLSDPYQLLLDSGIVTDSNKTISDNKKTVTRKMTLR